MDTSDPGKLKILLSLMANAFGEPFRVSDDGLSLEWMQPGETAVGFGPHHASPPGECVLARLENVLDAAALNKTDLLSMLDRMSVRV